MMFDSDDDARKYLLSRPREGQQSAVLGWAARTRKKEVSLAADKNVYGTSSVQRKHFAGIGLQREAEMSSIRFIGQK
jgi:hypothetical protein